MALQSQAQSFIAEAAVLPYRAVKFGTTDGVVIQGTAAGDAVIGIADNLGQATAAARIDVYKSGPAEAEAGAAITRGALLMIDSSARVITAAAGAGANVSVVGRALASAGAAGEIIPIEISLGSFQG